MKNVHIPRDLFIDQLRDIYSMEVQIGQSMPHLVALCANESLRELIERHAQQNCIQIAEISKIFERHGELPGGDTCKAMAGLIEGGTSHLRDVKDPHTRDLMMIAHCLRIEYHEMAAYEITSLLAVRLGMIQEQELLTELLGEEKDMAAALLEWEPFLFEIADGTPEVVRSSHQISERQKAVSFLASSWMIMKSWFSKSSEWQQ